MLNNELQHKEKKSNLNNEFFNFFFFEKKIKFFNNPINKLIDLFFFFFNIKLNKKNKIRASIRIKQTHNLKKNLNIYNNTDLSYIGLKQL